MCHPQAFKLAPLSCFLFEIGLEALSAEGAGESAGGRGACPHSLRCSSGCCCCCSDKLFSFSVLSSRIASTDFKFPAGPLTLSQSSSTLPESPPAFWYAVLFEYDPGDCSGSKTNNRIVFACRSRSFHKWESVKAAWFMVLCYSTLDRLRHAS